MEQLTKNQRFQARKRAEEPWYFHATKLKHRTLNAGGSISLDDALSLCKEVWFRDNGSCQYESESPCNGFLGMHHVDWNPLNNVASNLKIVCNSHHRSQHIPAHTGHKHSEETKERIRQKKTGQKVLRIDLEKLNELNDAGYTKSKIAREMGIARSTVDRNMKRYDIESKSKDGRSLRRKYPKRENNKWK